MMIDDLKYFHNLLVHGQLYIFNTTIINLWNFENILANGKDSTPSQYIPFGFIQFVILDTVMVSVGKLQKYV